MPDHPQNRRRGGDHQPRGLQILLSGPQTVFTRAARFPWMFEPLRHREFRLLFLGQSISAFGDRLVHVALTFAVLRIGGSAGDVGIVLAAATVPFVVFLLVGGVWADRLPRQKVMLASDGVRAVSQMWAGYLLIAGSAEIWHLIVLQAVYGTAEAFFQPAQTGLVPLTVPPKEIQKANALIGFTRNFTNVIGPATAGVLVATVGPGAALVVDGGTYIASAVFLALMKPSVVAGEVELQNFLSDLKDGWTEFVSRQWLWVSVVVFSFWQAIVLAPYLVLGPVVADRALGGASAFALISATYGVGSVLGTVLALRIEPSRPLVWMYLLVLPESLKLLLFAIEAPVPLVALAAGISGIGMSFGITMWFTAMQEHVPQRSLSRVSAYDWMGSVMMLPVGLAVAGALSETLGTGPVLIGAAVWNIFGVGLPLILLPSIRSLGRRDQPQPIEPALQAPHQV